MPDRLRWQTTRLRTEIDAAGRVVAPGFIDAHAHGNAEMNPVFSQFLVAGRDLHRTGNGLAGVREWMIFRLGCSV